MSLLAPDMDAALDDLLGTMPRELADGLKRYLRQGIRPGGFLQAVLRNDLADAARRADGLNMVRLATYVLLLDVAAPADAWGSGDKLEAWIAKGAEWRRTHTP